MTTKLKEYPLLDYSKYESSSHIIPFFTEITNSSNSSKAIYYCAIRHTFDPDDVLFEQIKNAFVSFKPDLVILESSTKINKSYSERTEYLNKIRNTGTKKLVEERGEFGFSLKLALDNNIEVYCPELEFIDQVMSLTLSYSLEEVFVSKILEMAVQFDTMNNNASLDDYLNDEIKYQKKLFAKEIKWDRFDFTLENFKNCFYNITNHKFNETNCDFWRELDDPIPWKEKVFEWTILNDISQANTNFRDNFILTQIQEQLEVYSRIFIVYGGSHYYAQEKALKKILQI